HNHINISKGQPSFGGGLDRHFLEEHQCVTLIDLGAFFPAVWCLAPVRRHAGVTGLDTGVGIEGLHPGKMWKNRLRSLPRLTLMDAIFRIGSCDRQNGDVQGARHLTISMPLCERSLHTISLECPSVS